MFARLWVLICSTRMAWGADFQLLSLRTTLAQQSCAFVQEVTEALGSALDPFVENLLPILAKMG